MPASTNVHLSVGKSITFSTIQSYSKVTHVHYGGCVPDCFWLFSVSVLCKLS